MRTNANTRFQRSGIESEWNKVCLRFARHVATANTYSTVHWILSSTQMPHTSTKPIDLVVFAMPFAHLHIQMRCDSINGKNEFWPNRAHDITMLPICTKNIIFGHLFDRTGQAQLMKILPSKFVYRIRSLIYFQTILLYLCLVLDEPTHSFTGVCGRWNDFRWRRQF